VIISGCPQPSRKVLNFSVIVPLKIMKATTIPAKAATGPGN